MAVDTIKNDKCLTLKDIASWVKSKECQYYFVEDIIDYKSTNPITNKEYNKLIELFKSYSDKNIKDIKKLKLIEKDIPSEEEFIDTLKEYKILKKYIDNIELEDINSIFNNKNFNIKTIKYSLNSIKNQLLFLNNNGFETLVSQYEKDKNVPVKLNNFYTNSMKLLKKLAFFNKRIYSMNIYVPKDIEILDFKKELNEIYKDIKENGKLTLKCKMKNIAIFNLIKRCRINKCKIETVNHYLVMYNYMKMKSMEKKLINYWNENCNEFFLERINEINISKLLFIENKLQQIKNIIDFEDSYKSQILKEFARDNLREFSIYNIDNIEDLYNLVLIKERESTLKNLKRKIVKTSRMFSDISILKEFYTYAYNYNYEGIKKMYTIIEDNLKKYEDIIIMEEIISKIKSTLPMFYVNLMSRKSEYFKLDYEELFEYVKYKSLLSGNLKKNKNIRCSTVSKENYKQCS
ncbi:hypothetical protein [Clostridium senegalense]|uniref:Uncharacterized protein n=1 Tax=Clostridium senegalense TaxID=1465809 RepID=A0A6M0H1Z6_9CLOT|nr:hypothetical protein [Clostridium senegalense]NEU04194.1 hypothetical protein [Clostridium senegalense]